MQYNPLFGSGSSNSSGGSSDGDLPHSSSTTSSSHGFLEGRGDDGAEEEEEYDDDDVERADGGGSRSKASKRSPMTTSSSIATSGSEFDSSSSSNPNPNPNHLGLGDDELGEDEEEREKELLKQVENSTTFDKLKILIGQAAPVVVSFFIGIGANFINLIFAGHHDKSGVVFAGVSLASMFINVSCMSILIGMTAAVETLGSQNNGARNYEGVGYILQRSCIVLYAICIPILILWYFTRDIFSNLGLEPEVVDVMVTFVKIRAFSLPIDVINESYEKYLMSIGVMNPSMWANILFSFFLLFFDTLFTFVFKFDYRGLAISWVISVYLQTIVQYYLSLRYIEVERTLQPINFTKACEDIKQFVSLGIPGTVMLCSEWWAYEFLTMMASLLGTADVAAQTIIIQVATLAFMIPLGIGIATSSLVGNSIGAGKILLAKEISHLAIALISGVELFAGLLIYFFGLYFMQIFTSNEAILVVAEKAIPFLSVFTFFDGLQGVTSGILRGVGKQTIGAAANVVAFYAIGLPMAWQICFRWKLGVRGLMMGISLGTLFQISVNLCLIFCFSSYLFTPSIAKDAERERQGAEESEMSISDIGNSNSSNSSSFDLSSVGGFSQQTYKKLTQRVPLDDNSNHGDFNINNNDNDNDNDDDDLDSKDAETLAKLSKQIELSSWTPTK